MYINFTLRKAYYNIIECKKAVVWGMDKTRMAVILLISEAGWWTHVGSLYYTLCMFDIFHSEKSEEKKKKEID